MHGVDRHEEALSRRLVVQVAEGEAEAVVTFEPGGGGGGGVRVPQTVHLHVVLSEVLSGQQLGPPRLRLQTRTIRNTERSTGQSGNTGSILHFVTCLSSRAQTKLKTVVEPFEF